MTLAKRIRDWRYAKGWGPDELAGRAEISRTALYQIECGKTETPRAATLSRIARALGVPVETLLSTDPARVRGHLSVIREGGPDSDFGDPYAFAPESSDSSDADAELGLDDAHSGPGGGVARFRDLERKLHEVLESPLGESVARILEESYRLLPSEHPRVVV
jgi:transcriptional regulator with XRE-family HTH domain